MRSRHRCVAALLVLAACWVGAPSLTAAQLGPVPSWQLNQGVPNSCSGEGALFVPGVDTNIPVGQASEQGVLSAPGHPNLGPVMDTAFGPHVGLVGFLLSVGGYSLPPNTPLTLTVTTYNGTNFTGGVSYVSRITWNCTTGAVIRGPAVPAPALSHLALALLSLTLLMLGGMCLSRR